MMMPNEKPLTFLASIAPLQSAMTISHDGGCRMKIDIPETELVKIKRLMGLRGKVLRVTITTVRQRPQGDGWGDDDDEDTDDDTA
jgi:hypothetical protein